MKRLIEFALQDGGTILVEVEEFPDEGGVVKAGRPGEVVTKAKETLEDAIDKILPAAHAVAAKLRGLQDAPDEVSIEFGVKLSAEAGAFIASAGVEANYKVTLKWAKT